MPSKLRRDIFHSVQFRIWAVASQQSLFNLGLEQSSLKHRALVRRKIISIQGHCYRLGKSNAPSSLSITTDFLNVCKAVEPEILMLASLHINSFLPLVSQYIPGHFDYFLFSSCSFA